MKTTIQRMGRVYRVLRKVHHVRVIPLFLAVLFGFLRFAVWFFMGLDKIFFAKLRSTRAQRPIVIVGNPRTGTTFLQRFLADNGYGAGMELFLMLYPSLVLQAILKPVLPILEKLSPAKFHSTEAHHTSLTSVETDDVAILFRYVDGFFLYGFFLAFDEEELWPEFDPNVRDTAERDFAWLEALWSRSLVKHDAQRNIAKLFSLSVKLPKFLAEFPQAQILYMARDPVEVLPSSMSLVIGVLDRAFGFWSLPPDIQKRWLDRLYFGFIILLKRFHEDWSNGAIDRSRVYIVRYDRMMSEFENVMSEMSSFLGQEMTPELKAIVAARGEKQRSYKSEHSYDLAKFGLVEEKIRKDCAFYYETFLPELKQQSA